MCVWQQSEQQQRREFLDQHREARMREAEVLQVKRRPSLLSADQTYQHTHGAHAQLDRDRSVCML